MHGVGQGSETITPQVFVTGLNQPFGIAFYPPGPNPQYIYIGNTGSVVRFPYRNGDLKARGPSEMIVKNIPSGGQAGGRRPLDAGRDFLRRWQENVRVGGIAFERSHG